MRFNHFLPYGRQTIDDDDIAAVTEVLRSDWLTTGPTVAAFEEAFAAKVGAKYAVSCSSGTAALHLAAIALGLGEGDVVIVPSLTFVATANAARYVGADVCLADVDPDTGLMRDQDLRQALERAPAGKVRAVFPVHLNGQSVDMEAISSVAGEHDLAIVVDACHALGTTSVDCDDRKALVGSCQNGELVVFSFHPVKTLAMGEGGMITTNDRDLRDRLLRPRGHGIVREEAEFESPELACDDKGNRNTWYQEMVEIGFNYRASDIHCALGLSQLSKLDSFVAKRQGLARYYDDKLGALAPAVRPVRRVDDCDPAWHLYVVLIDFAALKLTRSEVMARLREWDVGTQVHYVPVHQQPYYQNKYGAQTLPGAESYYARALSLPLFPTMTFEDVDRVVAALSDAVRR
ncbi:MAG: UDP-4-amino-4,6-dideoxy-N-acetyl-beta-L-altrosamine transaminase [Rhodospirillaceae bacterium]|jgi:UDP-4-amino-4,6-dideoxy-N-acetyl-beta-L-altrosamine transaminase|nr:UDP-4-amino-4,6-dideoxy-N-acetyl-beta-L-altrosamine transaminase [Rhodospirillaceae bacterium]MBT6428731.1 UDP-4-amino-4,6-dideoxy-N-acetyl-beta-L-altrosamine transaminase [Rhodospirillaceae bacterium]